MKAKNNTLKIILAILVIILISLISFIGIFVKDKNKMRNILPDYELGMDLAGGRTFSIKPDESVERKYYDENGNEIDSSEKEDGKEYTIKEINEDEEITLNDESYEKVKEVIMERLKTLGITEYEVRKNASNGEIYITIPENSNTDIIISDMTPSGEFKIIDSEENSDKLITSDQVKLIDDKLKELNVSEFNVMIKKVTNQEGSNETSDEESTSITESIQIDIIVPEDIDTNTEITDLDGYKFLHQEEEGETLVTSDEMKEIKEKLSGKTYEIRKNKDDEEIYIFTYKVNTQDISEIAKFKVKDNILLEKEDIKDVKVGYDSSTATVYLNIQFNKKGTEKLREISKEYVTVTDEEGNEVKKQIDLVLDGETQLSTVFAEEITDGLLQLSMGSSSTSQTNSQLQDSLNQASNLAVLLKTQTLPLTYTSDQNLYIESDITNDVLRVGLIIALIIFAIIAIGTIIKYKKSGLFTIISLIGYVATLLIALRYTNVVITISGILAIVLSIVIAYIYIINTIKNSRKNKEEEKNLLFKELSICIPSLIISIVFCFVKNLQLASFGMVMFWAILVMIIYNLAITKVLISNSEK